MRLLDLFCGAGGAAMGYSRAGFDQITGVDLKPTPRYPFDFVQADALEYLARLIKSGEIAEYDAIHASPPCQAYSVTSHLSNGTHKELVPQTRKFLIASGLPYVIENVPGAPLDNPLMLCGSMFGLPLIRHRLFECNPEIWFPPATCQCSGLMTKSGNGVSSFGNGSTAITVAGHNYIKADAEQAMDISWMIRDELSQAIPPAYTEWIGKKMIEAIQKQVPNHRETAVLPLGPFLPS